MVKASETKFFSGGFKGTEAAFGENCEKWGVEETNFSYEGHEIVRERGVKMLSEEDLRKGDISMEIVCQRMGRGYSQIHKIKKVMQSIFHIVNNGFQVFIVGWVKEDNTVKGGTGWAVELAKLFHRPIHVYDQDKNCWFTWKENTWVEDMPVISHETFCGTGTRNLSGEGEKAIAELFERSFG